MSNVCEEISRRGAETQRAQSECGNCGCDECPRGEAELRRGGGNERNHLRTSAPPRETDAGNAAAMREALEKIDRIVWDKRRHTKEETEAHRLATEALTTPPRNCDVGTVEEQAERYGRYCDKFTRDGMHCETCPCCGKIPFGKCEFAWSQLPYEAEKGAAE